MQYSTQITSLILAILSIHSAWCGADSGIFLNTVAFTSRKIDATIQTLQSSLEISCENDGIHVALSREKVIGLGVIAPEQVTLLDPSCSSEVNRTHFQLIAGINSCDTDYEISSEKTTATLLNKLRISPPAIVQSNPELAARTEVVELDVTCTYRNGGSERTTLPWQSSTAISQGSNIQIAQLDIYNTDSYRNKMGSKDLLGITRGTSLYVQINAYNDAGLNQNVFVHSCYFNPDPQPDVSTESRFLIRKGCQIDRDVQFKQDRLNVPKKFLFRARRVFGNKPMYLFCSLIPCFGIGQEECTTQARYCADDRDIDPNLLSYVSLANSMTVIKRPAPTPAARKPVTHAVTTSRIQATQSSLANAMKDQIRSCPPQKTEPCNCPSAEDGRSSFSRSSSGGVVSIELTIVVVILSFVMGAGLILIICYVKKRTDPRRKMQAVAMSDDGSSSQESTLPGVKLMGSPHSLPTSFES